MESRALGSGRSIPAASLSEIFRTGTFLRFIREILADCGWAREPLPLAYSRFVCLFRIVRSVLWRRRLRRRTTASR